MIIVDGLEKDIRDQALAMGLEILKKRMERLQRRRFVLFPFLRARLMLHRVAVLKRLSDAI